MKFFALISVVLFVGSSSIAEEVVFDQTMVCYPTELMELAGGSCTSRHIYDKMEEVNVYDLEVIHEYKSGEVNFDQVETVVAQVQQGFENVGEALLVVETDCKGFGIKVDFASLAVGDVAFYTDPVSLQLVQTSFQESDQSGSVNLPMNLTGFAGGYKRAASFTVSLNSEADGTHQAMMSIEDEEATAYTCLSAQHTEPEIEIEDSIAVEPIVITKE